jgi:Flp pilus assembly protein TadG
MQLKSFARQTDRSRQGGAHIAEAAFVLPILFLILMGIFWFALAFNVSTTVERAAKQGMMVAARPTCATCGNASSNSAAVSAIQSTLVADHLEPGNIVSYAPGFVCTGGGTGCSTTSNVQICTTAPLNCGNASCQDPPAACGSGVTRGVRVSFAYRYRSPVPLGGWSAITIPATAQAPREN